MQLGVLILDILNYSIKVKVTNDTGDNNATNKRKINHNLLKNKINTNNKRVHQAPFLFVIKVVRVTKRGQKKNRPM